MTTAVLEATLELLTASEPLPSMRAIARRAGVGVASIYDHFDGRQGLMDAVLSRVTERNFSRLARHLQPDDLPLEVVLERLVDDAFATYTDTPALTAVALSTLVRMDRMHFVQAERDRFSRLVADRLQTELEVERSVLDLRIRTVIDMIMGAVIATLHRSPPADIAPVRAVVLDLVLTELSTLRSLARTP